MFSVLRKISKKSVYFILDKVFGILLRHAISQGNRIRSLALISFNFGLTDKGWFDGKSPIHWAAIKGDEYVIRALLNAGVSLDSQTTKGITPLMLATSYGQIECVKTLIKCGADLDMQNKEMSTAVLIGADKGDVEILDFLIEAGADLNIKDHKGRTALMLVAQKVGVETVEKMIKAGAKPEIADNDEHFIWDYAKNNTDLNVAVFLEKYAIIREKLKSASYEDLISLSQRKEACTVLLKMGSLASVLECTSIDSYEKLKKVYHEVIPYAQENSSLKKQIQNSFINKRNQLMR